MKVRFDREVWIAAFFAALPAQSVAQSAPETRTRIPVDQPLVDPDLKGAPWVAPPKEGSLPSDRSALTLEERQQAVRELDEQRFPMRTGVPAVSDKEGAAPDTSNMRSGVDARTFYQLETAADGTVWAIGGTYKASFGPEGASYVPFLGSDAPQNYPLNLHLESVTLEGENLLFDAAAWPVLEGNSAVYRRGTFEERYATAVGSIEQTFVFDRLPARGELRVRMGVESELQPGSAAEGLVFSNDRGSVTYSNAVAFDARGRAVEAPTTFVDGSIEIRVPEAFVAGATLPITIDPIVATYSPSVSTNLDYNADISWDDSNSRFMICWERAFSLTDHDVWAEMFTALGAPIAGSGAYIDFTTQSWTLPKCANNRFQGQFLVAAVVTSSTPSEIWARTREAENLTMSAPIQVSAFTGNKKWVDVGGDRFLGSNAYYCVVWEREYNPGIDHDIHAQLMNTSGALEGTSIMVDNTSGTFDKYPSISNGNDAHTWTVAWNREFNASDWDIRGAQISWGGAIATPSQSVDFSGFNDLMPKVSTPLDQVAGAELNLFVYHRNVGTHWEVMGLVMRGTDIVAAENLSQTWSPFNALDEEYPTVDSNGQHWAVTYMHRFTSSGSDFDIRVASVYLTGSTIDVAEGPLTLAASSTIESRPECCARRTGGTNSNFVGAVWTDQFAGAQQGDIEGATYQMLDAFGQISFPFCFANSNSSGQPAWMMATGSGAIGRDDLVLEAYQLPTFQTAIFLDSLSQGTPFVPTGSMGNLCLGGAIGRFNAASQILNSGASGSVSLRLSLGAFATPFGPTPVLSGQTWNFQAWFRDFVGVSTSNFTHGVSVHFN